MLIWDRRKNGSWLAVSNLFKYVVEEIRDNEFYWFLKINNQYAGSDGPYDLEQAKRTAQMDYEARSVYQEKCFE